MTQDYATLAEAAAELGLEESWVRRLCAAGRIEGAFKLGRDWLIPRPIVRVRQRKSSNRSRLIVNGS